MEVYSSVFILNFYERIIKSCSLYFSFIFLSPLPSAISDLEQGVYSASCVDAVKVWFLYLQWAEHFTDLPTTHHMLMSLFHCRNGLENEPAVGDGNRNILCKYSFRYTLHTFLYSIEKSFCLLTKQSCQVSSKNEIKQMIVWKCVHALWISTINPHLFACSLS